MSTNNPHATDIIVGQNVRRIRTARRISQTDMAIPLGITFQQVQKYEKGTNRISASRMVQICQVLGCAIMDLFAGVEAADAPAIALPGWSARALRMAEAFDRIEDEAQRRHLVALVETLANPLQVAEAFKHISLADLNAANGAAV